jgi:V8-like Glu-specific endopeptidase
LDCHHHEKNADNSDVKYYIFHLLTCLILVGWTHSANAKASQLELNYCTQKPSGTLEDLIQAGNLLSEKIQGPANQRTEGRSGKGPDYAIKHGEETRELVDKPVHPWTAVGQISSYYKACTATLISECIVVTAGHCSSPDRKNKPQPIDFTPRFGSEKYKSEKWVLPSQWMLEKEDFEKWKKDIGHATPGFDWALIKLRGRPGQKYGYVGVEGGLNKRKLASIKQFFVAGYSTDFQGGELSVDKDANEVNLMTHWKEEEKNFLYYHADLGDGASGGPILGLIDDKFYLLGVVTSSGANDNSLAMGAPSANFFNEFNKLNAEKCED